MPLLVTVSLMSEVSEMKAQMRDCFQIKFIYALLILQEILAITLVSAVRFASGNVTSEQNKS